MGLPWWLSGKQSAGQCWRRGFDPWVQGWRRKWQLTPVFLPGKSHGQSLEGYSLWRCKRVRQDLETKQQQATEAIAAPWTLSNASHLTGEFPAMEPVSHMHSIPHIPSSLHPVFEACRPRFIYSASASRATL